MKKIFRNVIVKLLVLTILPGAISVLSSWCFSIPESSKKDTVLTAIAIIVILNIIALIFYGVDENKRKKNYESYDRLLKTNNALSRECVVTSEIIFKSANSIYDQIKSYKEKKKIDEHSEIQNWPQVKADCDPICEAIYNMLTNEIAACGKQFAVNIIFRKTEKGVKGFTMLSRTAYTSHAPGLYGSFVSEESVNGYYYKSLFDHPKSRPSFLFTKEEISGAFVNSGDVVYSQYIGIPISCPGNRMIALLQIIAYNDTKLASSRQELENLYDNYFCVFSNLVLLSDKIENVQQIMKKAK